MNGVVFESRLFERTVIGVEPRGVPEGTATHISVSLQGEPPAQAPPPVALAPEPEVSYDTFVVPVTVKSDEPVPEPASGFVTLTLLATAGAEVAMLIFSVTWVELLKVVLFTVMPVPEKVALEPFAKPVPLRTMLRLLDP